MTINQRRETVVPVMLANLVHDATRPATLDYGIGMGVSTDYPTLSTERLTQFIRDYKSGKLDAIFPPCSRLKGESYVNGDKGL